MKFNITAITMGSRELIFSAQSTFVPRQDEEIEIDGIIFIVKSVRYQMATGNSAIQNVLLSLVRD